MTTTLLVTGAGGPGAVNMTRSLQEANGYRLIGCDASQDFVHLALTDEKILVPRCSDRDAYVDAINRICKAYEVDLIVPNNSLEAHVLSAERNTLSAPVYLPSVPTLDTANSKWLSYQVWSNAGLPVPQSWLIEDRAHVRDVFGSCERRPLWIRGAGIPGKGIGGAALPCRSLLQAEAWIDYYQGWGHMMASEFLPGANLTWIGLWKNGELITSQGRERLAYVIPHVSPSGITGAPAVSRTVHRDDLNTLGPKASLAIDKNLTGVCFLDFKCDAHGAPHLTEMNAGRFGTTHHFYTVAGVNFPDLLVRLALGRPVSSDDSPLPPFNPLPEGLTWIRTLDAGPVLLQPNESLSGIVQASDLTDV
jgi:biotin carboxylase